LTPSFDDANVISDRGHWRLALPQADIAPSARLTYKYECESDLLLAILKMAVPHLSYRSSL